MHELKCFVTLTYDDEHLPSRGTLVKADFQKFMKRLRKQHVGELRYFHCGEYGEQTMRPHYHAILYGCDFSDKRFHTKNERGDSFYKSDLLERLWGKGQCLISSVNWRTARYTASYILKKVTGEMAEGYYDGRLPEYVTMSLKPGIGQSWYDKYQSDVFPCDYVIIEGKKKIVPKFYTSKLEKSDKESHDEIKYQRVTKSIKQKANNTRARLLVREEVMQAKHKLSTRKL